MKGAKSKVISSSFSADRLIKARKNIISTFNWNDPVKQGETAINNFLNTVEILKYLQTKDYARTYINLKNRNRWSVSYYIKLFKRRIFN